MPFWLAVMLLLLSMLGSVLSHRYLRKPVQIDLRYALRPAWQWYVPLISD